MVCLSRLANTLWLLGRADDAARTRDAALALAEQIGAPVQPRVARVCARRCSPSTGATRRSCAHADALAAAATGHAAGHAASPPGARRLRRRPRRPGRGRPRAHPRGLTDARGGDPAAPGERGDARPRPARGLRVAGDARAGLAAADRALAAGGASAVGGGGPPAARRSSSPRSARPPRRLEAELDRAVAVAERQDARALALRARRAWTASRGTRRGTLAERHRGRCPRTTADRREEHLDVSPGAETEDRRSESASCAPGSAARCCGPARRATTRRAGSGTARSTGARR